MKAFRITYRNYDLKKSAISRLKEDLKYIFWVKGREPENWDDFNDEIEFNTEQDRGGDCVEMVFAETVSDSWETSMLKDLLKKKSIRSVERRTNNEYIKF